MKKIKEKENQAQQQQSQQQQQQSSMHQSNDPTFHSSSDESRVHTNVSKGNNNKNRYMEPFQIFCLFNRRDLQANHQNLTPSEITSLLSQIWKALDLSKRNTYIDMANNYNSQQNDDNITYVQTARTVNTQLNYLPKIYVIPRGNNDLSKIISNISKSIICKDRKND